MASDPLQRAMTLDEFAPLVGREFVADCAPRTVGLVLVSASPAARNDRLARPAFSLLFRSGPDTLLVSGAYRMWCGPFGPDIVYITPTTPPIGDAPGYYYEAVFN